MQSFIQYRKFRTAIKAQLERDRVKLQQDEKEPAAAHDDDSPSSSASKDSGVEGNEPDLERGRRRSSRRDAAQAEDVNARDFREPAEEQAPVEEEEEEEDADDYELGQYSTRQRSVSRSTTQSAGTRLGTVLSGVEVRRRTTKEGGEGNVFVVSYESDDDPLNPHNWSNFTRIRCTLTVAGIGCVVGFASAIDSAATLRIAKALHTTPVVESLATGLFLIGFGAGALTAGPFSETFGRNPVYIFTLTMYMIFVMASGLARNIEEQLVFRFIAGYFGSTPLTCAGGSISDLWNPLERVITFPIFANAAFTGPLLGPVGMYFPCPVVLTLWILGC